MNSSEAEPVEDLADLYENAPCGYVSLNREGRIVKVNATFTRWLDRPAEALLGKRLRDLLNVAGAIFYETHFAPLLRMQGFFNEVALDLVMPDGGVLPVLANAAERRDEAGTLLFTRLTIFPASQRRRFERDLVESNQDLRAEIADQMAARLVEQQTAETREQFIAVLGHDLRNPLASIEAGTRLLLKDGWTARSPRVLSLMLNSARRMGGLIDNVLDLARSRLGGGIVLDLDNDRPLEPTLEQVIEEIRAANPERVIAAEIAVPHAVAVDHLRLAQMFSNLLGNAVSHGAADRPIVVSAVVADGVLALSVSNGGDPIPAEMVEHLFKAFHRGQVKGNAEGLGLGLFIASQIAEAHGGRIEVASDEHETRFTFRMDVR